MCKITQLCGVLRAKGIVGVQGSVNILLRHFKKRTPMRELQAALLSRYPIAQQADFTCRLALAILYWKSFRSLELALGREQMLLRDLLLASKEKLREL